MGEITPVGRKMKQNDNGNGSLMERYTLIDDNGNKIAYNLYAIPTDGGYLTGVMNIAPYNVTEEGFGNDDLYFSNRQAWMKAMEERDAGMAKITADAKKYFVEHPEEKEKIYGSDSMKNNRSVQFNEYCDRMILKSIAEREQRGEATPLERAYLHQSEYIEQNKIPYTFAQLTGEMSFDDIDAAKMQVQKDKEQEAREAAADLQRSEVAIKNGEQSLRNRLQASSQNAFKKMNTITSDGQKTLQAETPDLSSEKTVYTKEEIAALVSYKLRNKQRK